MKTPLYQHHLDLGAKMIPFAGWEMPIQYEGIVQEHLAVRSAVGLFDVSHMGRIFVEGPDAEALLDFLSTNPIAGKADHSATYTVWCLPTGNALDDLLVYKRDATRFFIVVNAANRTKDLEHLKRYAQDFDVKIQDHYASDAILALQGPASERWIEKIFPQASNLKHMTFAEYGPIDVASAGYTGENGFEIYGSREMIVSAWESLIRMGVKPVGLGARDTLRQEMGYALYGHELSESILPTESVAHWTVKNFDRNFLGKEVLQRLPTRFACGAILDEGIAREGARVFFEGREVGTVTSGTHSPSLKKGIVLILANRTLKPGEPLEIEVRQKKLQARVSALPLIRRSV